MRKQRALQAAGSTDTEGLGRRGSVLTGFIGQLEGQQVSAREVSGEVRLAGEVEVHWQPGADQEPDCHSASHLMGQGLFLTRLTPPLPMTPVATAAVTSP